MCFITGNDRTMLSMDTLAPATDTDTPTRTRTRTAILNAAISLLLRNPGASLGEVADAASVARSTLHRYFPERADLLAAMKVFADHQIAAATGRARLTEGTAAEALVRLCHEYFDQWDPFMWSYVESLKGDDSSREEPDSFDPDLAAVIERGYVDGTIDPLLPNAWIQQTMWAVLYSAQEYVRQGGLRHQGLDLTLRTLQKVIAPSPAAGS